MHGRQGGSCQPLWHLGRDPGVLAAADAFKGSDRQQRIDDGPRLSASMAAGWRSGAAKALERQHAALAELHAAVAQPERVTT